MESVPTNAADPGVEREAEQPYAAVKKPKLQPRSSEALQRSGVPGSREIPSTNPQEPTLQSLDSAGADECCDIELEPPYVGSRAKRFFICVMVALVILMSYNMAIHYIAASSQRRQLLSDVKHIPANTDCLFIGNSLVEAGCDPKVFQSQWPSSQPFNIA